MKPGEPNKKPFPMQIEGHKGGENYLLVILALVLVALVSFAMGLYSLVK